MRPEQNEVRMKILIIGQAKSGTTALYHALKQSLSGKYTSLFEPKSYLANDGDQFTLAKVLINEFVNIDDFDNFDKKILIVRDPRDNLVSLLLYAIYDQKFITDDNKVNFFIDKLEKKQINPASISLIDLFKVLSDLSDKDLLELFTQRYQAGLLFDTHYQNYFVYKYEDFVTCRFSSLEEYLGFKLNFNGKVEEALGRVTRTKGSGDWRNWFTQQDVKYFSPIYHDYLVKYGYDLEWKLNPEPKILPEHSTVYVKGLIQLRRSTPQTNNENKKSILMIASRLLRLGRLKQLFKRE
jgi:hypothetical protein